MIFFLLRSNTPVTVDNIQVRSSGKKAIEHLHREFSELQRSLNAVLSVREAELEKEVQEAMSLDLSALAEIEDELQEYLTTTVECMAKGSDVSFSKITAS